MKKNINVIQIKGFWGIVYIGFIGVCLIAGFGWFPGWVSMHVWNFAASYFTQIPAIGIFQGILLWAIIAAAYFTFRKEKLVVCMNAAEDLDEEELKSVFAEIKKQAQNEPILKDMLKVKEAELKIKKLPNSNLKGMELYELKIPQTNKSSDIDKNCKEEEQSSLQSK